ncbi:MAG: class I SAM-dependent rRNA methyltransferase [Thermodesulfovibrionales bacterium]
MEVVYLKKTSRILNGHLWVFQNEIAGSLKKYEPGTIVELRDRKDQFLGIGYINPHSLITIRLLTRRKERINRSFFESRIKDAISYRQRVLPSIDSCRLIYSESDLLSGLIVDKYSDWLVIQSLTAGMDRYLPEIIDILESLIKPSTLFIKNDSPLRGLERLELKTEFVKGTAESPPVIKEGNIYLKVDPVHGQKTGFFLDQRENRLFLSGLIKGGTGLDLFCYSGAWGLQLARNGADVLFIDDSEKALMMARENAELNNLSERCSFLKTDVFDYLNKIKQKEYDFIILDPPAFVKSRSKIEEAIKGYRFINSVCMSLLKKGGIMATSSCSHHISREVFLDILRQAARGAGRTIRIIEFRSQAKDHPVLLQVPETEYLKCAILEVL